jgi:TatA/E family protein of Tat protein translocase
MFGSLGFTEIAFILVLALLLFGPKRLPEIGRTIGKGLGEFRRASNDLRRTLENEVALDEASERRPPLIQGPPRPVAVADTAPRVDAAATPGAGAAVDAPPEPAAGPNPAAGTVERAD